MTFNKMKDDKKTSIIKEALTDYNKIVEAAEGNAKKKLAEEYPDKFNKLIKEELQNKNKTAKESYKKIDEVQESNVLDESELNKESVMKNQKETNKVVNENAGEGKPFNEKAKGVKRVEEDVHITDTVGDGDPFDEKAKKGQKVDETAGDGKPFGEKAKKSLQTEEFDITELDVDSAGSALDNADNDDEVITMDEIENEISQMQGLGEELKGIESNSPSYMNKGNKGIAFDELVNMRNKLDEMIKGMGSVDEMHQGNFPLDKMHQGNYDNKLIDEKNVDEMHQAGNETFGSTSQVNRLHNDGPTDELIDEEGAITDADIEAVIGSGSEEQPAVDEAHGLAYSSRRQMAGRNLPNADHLSSSELDQAPYVQESKKKIGGLIEENKKLTKKLNETKKYKETVGSLVESYKTALEKYRNQLREMAIFNTNLAHVNNLLVNEELALTQDDKIEIINEFKKVDSIASSQKVYKHFLTEMKESKKTISETIEKKVSASIQSSSKQKLDEVIEKTAYANDEHINKMKRLIEYVEHRGKKNNI